MLQKGFFRTQSSNPDLPPDEWTLVDEITTPGAYSTTLSWGRYKIELSGAGGSGGASSATHADYKNWANNGSNGELTTNIINVFYGTSKTISGIIGQGGRSSYADSHPTPATATAGNGGTGYANGTRGNTVTRAAGLGADRSAAAGGAGGGSSNLNIDNVLTSVARGGNGGTSCADELPVTTAGTGGSGGVSSGTGASGGAGRFGYKVAATSGAGSNGFVRIYKSNVYPEPL